jgi:hypothetical protein
MFPAVVTATPLVTIVEPAMAAFVPALAAAPTLRPLGASLATLGLLAAGAAAVAFLWLRVLAPDTASFPLSRAAAPPAFRHETVQAREEAAPVHSTLPIGHRPSERAPRSSSPAVVLVARHAAARPALGKRRVRPALLARVAPPTATPSHPDHATGKGHLKHGKGHFKHGETDGVHSPGHGLHGHSKGNGKRKHG